MHVAGHERGAQSCCGEDEREKPKYGRELHGGLARRIRCTSGEDVECRGFKRMSNEGPCWWGDRRSDGKRVSCLESERHEGGGREEKERERARIRILDLCREHDSTRQRIHQFHFRLIYMMTTHLLFNSNPVNFSSAAPMHRQTNPNNNVTTTVLPAHSRTVAPSSPLYNR